MTDINKRGKLPFTVVSSSVDTGYSADLSSKVGATIDIVNKDRDEYGEIEGSPAQGPFTSQHVGGNQHRHVPLNTGTDNQNNRPEGYHISASAGSVKIYGPDVKGSDKPRATLTRNLTAKSPINIENVETSGNIAGNFEHNYQVVQSVGRRTSNNLINDNFVASGSLTTKFVSGSRQIYSLPDITNNSKSIFVQRFNAPGGKEESSRGALDREGEEFAPNNSLTTRNIKVRQPFYSQLTEHNKKYAFDEQQNDVTLNDIQMEDSVFSVSSSVAAKETLVRGFYFKEDGLTVYIAGQNSNKVHRYDLSTPFEIGTAAFTSTSIISLSARGISFKDDGTRMFLVASNNVYRYDLFVAWDITTATLIGNFNLGVAPTAVSFDSSGRKMFISTTTGGSFIKAYELSAAWDISSPSLVETLDVSEQQSIVTGFYFSVDGLEMIICGEGTPEYVLVKYSLQSDRSISTAKAVSTVYLKEEADIHDVYVTTEKNKLFTISSGKDSIYQYSLENTQIFHESRVIKNSISRIKETNGIYVTSSQNDNFWVQHAVPSTDLRYKWIAESISSSQEPIEYQSFQGEYDRNGAFNDLQFSLTSPFGDHLGISGAVDKDHVFSSVYTNTMYRDRRYLNFQSIASNSSSTFKINLNPISPDITEKDFTISFWVNIPENCSFGTDINNVKLLTSASISSQTSGVNGICFSGDGTKVYITNDSEQKIYQYSLSTPWNISTKSFSGQAALSSSTKASDLFLSPDGKYAFVLHSSSAGAASDQILRYTLSTNWDITTTGSLVKYPFTHDNNPDGMCFSRDGKNLYVVGSANDRIYQKQLSTSWDLSTTGALLQYSLTGLISPRAINISDDGKRIYVLDGDGKRIYYYILSTEYDVTTAINNSTNRASIEEIYNHGMWLEEKNRYAYIVKSGSGGDYIYQYDNIRGKAILQYSGSSSDNSLTLNLQNELEIEGNSVLNLSKIMPNINDGKWHLITLVSDLRSQQLRTSTTSPITLNSTKTKVYVDGGLISDNLQRYKKLNLSSIIFFPDLYDSGDDIKLDEIHVWDSALTETQIKECFKVSNSQYGRQPKKYVEHLFDSTRTSLPKPIHVYSSRIEDRQKFVFDEISNISASLVGYSISSNSAPTLNRAISYSTYFNGPYEGASWKFIRGNDHPVTRKLTTENTNIVSVLVPEKEKVITKTINDKPVRITLPGGRKQGTLLNVKEPPVYTNNKPLKHRFIFKNSVDKTNGYEIVHTYGNNLQYFASDQLNNVLALKNNEEQIYDRLYDFYGNEDVDENENPIEKLLGYTYSETIFPKKGDTFLKETRTRTDYITDQPGFSIDGYDRQLGTQRVFWRDNKEDRQRTENCYINSLGYQILTGSSFSTSIAALESLSGSYRRDYTTTYFGVPSIYSNVNFLNSGELNNFSYYVFKVITSSVYFSYDAPVSRSPQSYFFNSSSYSSPSRIINNPYYNDGDYLYLYDLRSYRPQPSYIYRPSQFISSNATTILSATLDYGLTRATELISGKKPWFDSYEKYSEDIRGLGKDHSRLYEFVMSDNMMSVIKNYGGDFRKVKFNNFKDGVIKNSNNKLTSQNKDFVKQEKIHFKLSAIKKLLPYNGFYPQDRSIQLVNFLKQSYIDTNAVSGGFNLRRTGQSIDIYDRSIAASEIYSLEKYAKEYSFLEPLYSPGIFFNTIKSGLAVDWSVFTGSMPLTGTSEYVVSTKTAPGYRVPFETIIDPYIGFSVYDTNLTASSRIMQTKDISLAENFNDYTANNNTYHFYPFFEIEKKSNPLYTLSVNNFFAETVNFFLNESKLNSFSSLPENQFKTMIAGKTYYMDVVLRKNDITMVDSYSSSLNDNYGNMKGMYFGPGYFTGTNVEETDISTYSRFHKVLRDPGYCVYTPPYFYGDAVARISFTPPDTRQYSLEEIFGDANIQNINLGLRNSARYPSGSLYESVSMPVQSSVNLFGKQLEQTVQFSPLSNIDPALRNSNNFSNLFGIARTTSNDSDNYRWVISTRMETPILDFSEQEYISSNTLISASQLEINITSAVPAFTPLTSSGFGIGMWSGYGQIPTGSQGVFIELRESFPQRRQELRSTSTTGSLMDVCGFVPQSRRIGEIADSKTISEAVVIIPYSTKKRNPSFIRKDGNLVRINGTKKIEGYNLFKISREVFQKQRSNIENGEPAVKQGDFGSNVFIQETSISGMIKLMNKYVIPPNFNFLQYSDIDPFVMYIAEFESTLDKQDLADIWQGVMPKPAMQAELDDVTLSHDNNIHNFFHGEGIPEDVKFMVFKVKRKAEINYYKMTADSTDDDRFRFDFKVGKKAPEYSFNWPYDYFSLVELAKIDIEIDYASKDDELKLQQSGNDIRAELQRQVDNRASGRGLNRRAGNRNNPGRVSNFLGTSNVERKNRK